jgi:hypothetical protein
MNQHKNELGGEDREDGTCALCRKQRQLRDSHLLPAGIYKLLRDPDLRNPNPVVVTPKLASTTSWQVTARLLCHQCEEQFSRRGERYVLAQCARGQQGFPLRESLHKLTSVHTEVVGTKTYGVYEVGSTLGEHVEEYMYFAASVFWRACARKWVREWQKFSLGADYQEQFRLYLLGQGGWPKHAQLVVHVSSDEIVDFAIDPISLTRGAGTHRCKFYVPGILFILFAGVGVAQPDVGAGVFNGLTGRFMWLCPFKEDSLYKGLLSVSREAMRNPRTLRPPDVSSAGK